MNARSSVLSVAGLAIAGSLGFAATGASAQVIYTDPFDQPYPVFVDPAYVAPAPVIAPPIVRQRTVVVRRPLAAPAYSYRAPIARYGYGGYYDAMDVVAPW